jgi:hypothetical protein
MKVTEYKENLFSRRAPPYFPISAYRVHEYNLRSFLISKITLCT